MILNELAICFTFNKQCTRQRMSFNKEEENTPSVLNYKIYFCFFYIYFIYYMYLANLSA